MERKRNDIIAELKAQIQEMKAEIEALKAAPKIELHSHFHTHQAPLNLPLAQPVNPLWPMPNTYPQITWGVDNQNAGFNRCQMLC
jgi:hypothetical protein